MKKITLLLCASVLSMAAWADQTVSGVVVDTNGEPVIGASVMVTGTAIGTITDFDGKFSMSVPDDAQTMTISYVGMGESVVAVGTSIRVVLRENAEMIQEVVVTGYGNVSKGSFAGSAIAVNADAIEKKTPSEISKALAGEVAGMQVITPSGQPGESADIRIRGAGSVNGGTAPLYVVDNIPYEGNLSSISPSDIASITVLKDATATSLYGSRGANGVVLITTKKGKSGEGKIDVEAHYGANLHILPMYDVVTSPEEYVEMAWLGMYNSSSKSDPYERADEANKELFSTLGIPSMYNIWEDAGNMLIGDNGKFYPDVQRKSGYRNMTSWADELFRVGQKGEAMLKISGGTDKTTYFTSFGYLKDEGYYIGSDFQRFNFRTSIEHEVKSWLKGSMNVSYTYSEKNAAGQDETMNNGFAYVNGIPAIYPVYLYNEDGTVKVDSKTGESAYDYGMIEGNGRAFGTGINPAGSLRYDRDQTQNHHLSGISSLEFTLYDGLKLTVNAGVQFQFAKASQYVNAYYGDAAGVGRTRKTQTDYLSFACNQLLEYSKAFGDHSLRVLAGHETQYARSGYTYGSKSNVAVTTGPSVLEWGNAVQMVAMNSRTDKYSLESYLATVSYIFAEKYGLTANYRADGSSKFAKGHRWGHFGSVGATWMFTNEAFLQNVKWLKNGKLRLSWGVQGNQDGITSDLFYDQYSVQNVGGQFSYVWGYKGNENLTWEKASQTDLGLEADLTKYLGIEFDYFHKLTSDMLFPMYVAPSHGYSYYYINAGKLVNQGVELQLNIHAVQTENVRLNVRLNTCHYTNKVLELPNYMGTDEEQLMSGNLSVGHGLNDYYMKTYLGVDAETGVALYQGYYDAKLGDFGINYGISAAEQRESGVALDGTHANYISNVYAYRQKYPDADIRTTATTAGAFAGYDYVGKSAVADLAGGFGFDLSVYGVSLSVSCSYGIGGYGYDNTYAALMNTSRAGTYNWHKDMHKAWNAFMTDAEKQAVADMGTAGIPKLSNGVDKYAIMRSTRFLTSNSFLSLNNVRLGYDFPEKLISKLHMSQLSVYVSGDNLALASARKGYHPMVSFSGSSGVYQYTPLSTIMGGIKLQF